MGRKRRSNIMKTLLKLCILCVALPGCLQKATYHEDISKTPVSYSKRQCADGTFATNCTSYSETSLPVGGYGGVGYVGGSYPVVPYTTISPGQSALMAYPGGATVVPAPTATTSTTVAAPSASASSDVNAKLEAVAKTVHEQSKEICKMKKGKNCK